MVSMFKKSHVCVMFTVRYILCSVNKITWWWFFPMTMSRLIYYLCHNNQSIGTSSIPIYRILYDISNCYMCWSNKYKTQFPRKTQSSNFLSWYGQTLEEFSAITAKWKRKYLKHSDIGFAIFDSDFAVNAAYCASHYI